MQSFDVAVVGAGIVGASCAFRLSERGLRVVVLEKHEAAAMGSTGWSAGGVRVQFGDPTNVKLSLASIREFCDFPRLYGRDAGYRPVGYLLLVPAAIWEQHLQAVDLQRSLGAPVEVLDVEETAERFGSFTADGLAGATYGPIDGVVDPHSVTHVYLDAARQHGSEIRFRAPVTEIDRDGEGWMVVAGQRPFRAGAIVNAAGAWAGHVGRLAGMDIPVEPVRRTVYVTAATPGRQPTPLTVDLASGLYFRSEGDRLIFGRSTENQEPGFVTGVDWESLTPTLEAAIGRFPWFAQERLDADACWSGYYEVTPDHGPLLGRDSNEPTWLNACGFSGHGVQQAPAVGRAIAEEAIDGGSHSIDIEAFRGSRFSRGQQTAETNII